ncbi:MAG TPA: ribosomal protein S18-alanine N-acetyltransferase [Acidiferrobacterales bacterium]|nr:ribosomal protein S18-alanine N-acetyltransferase [Acidiferrobacterales bacterium]
MSQTSKAFGIVHAGSRAAVTGSRLFHLRRMQEQDLKTVMAVEHAAYEFPWTEGIFRDCLRVGYDCRVIEIPNNIIGHGVMSVAAGECHLLNICVHPLYQRRGLGRQLVEHLLELARRKKAHTALLEVRRSHKIAYQLYTHLGFNEIGARKNYYPARRGREDALILAREL